MKVLLINGSPHKEGTTYAALKEAEKVLKSEGIDTEILHIGTAGVRGCSVCLGCKDGGGCVIEPMMKYALTAYLALSLLPITIPLPT